MAEYGLKHSLIVVAGRAGKGEKFVTLLLLFILLTTTMAGVSAVLTGPDWVSLWQSLLFGMLVGWLLAIFRGPAWRAALLVIGLGLLFSLLFSGGLSQKVMMVPAEFFRLTGSVIASLKIKGVDLTPLSIAVQQTFSSTGIVLGRVAAWIKDLTSGATQLRPRGSRPGVGICGLDGGSLGRMGGRSGRKCHIGGTSCPIFKFIHPLVWTIRLCLDLSDPRSDPGAYRSCAIRPA